MPVETRSQPLREVILSGSAALQLEEAKKKFPRAGEVFAGLKWRLERQAEIGVPIPFEALIGKPGAADVRVIRSQEMAELPVVFLIYKCDATTVTVMRVRAFPPGQDPTF